MGKSKVYYLAHPLTSNGTMEHNYQDEEFWAGVLEEDGYKNLMRPLKLIPSDWDRISANRFWATMLPLCDGVIVTGKWRMSVGCQQEIALANMIGIPVFEAKIDDLDGKKGLRFVRVNNHGLGGNE